MNYNVIPFITVLSFVVLAQSDVVLLQQGLIKLPLQGYLAPSKAIIGRHQNNE